MSSAYYKTPTKLTGSESHSGSRHAKQSARTYREVDDDLSAEEIIVGQVPERLSEWVRGANGELKWRNRMMYIIPLLFTKLMVLSSELSGYIVAHFTPRDPIVNLDRKRETEWVLTSFNTFLEEIMECHVTFAAHWLEHNEAGKKYWNQYLEARYVLFVNHA
jgi:hypothetical protein